LEFGNPYMLLLAAIPPVAFYLGARRKRRAAPMPGISAMKGLPRARYVNLPRALLAVACVLLALASARPRVEAGTEEQKLKGVDVALALDVSGSMKAEDFKPNRIEAAKSRVKEFAAGFHEGRMALVAFAGRSFTQCPLTSDAGILEGLIDQLDVGSVTIDGTAIGDAIINAVAKFKDDAGSRVIILLTDGENNAGTVDPVTAARAAKTKGVKIYTIGVGTTEGAPIPVTGPSGEKFYLKDQTGNVVLAKVDEKSLKEIADITGGTFFRATDESALREVYAKIAAMEKSEIKVKTRKNYRELFPYPAATALALTLCAGWLMAGRRRFLS